MIRATHVCRSQAPGQTAGQVVLAFDDRYRRRCKLTTEDGFAFLLDLPEPVVLQQHDRLVLEDGQLIEVIAAKEPLMEAVPGQDLSMARMAWHIGNRHLEAEITDTAIRLRLDHVIKSMLEQLGAEVTEINAPFSPEGGAYGHGRTHGHDHAHSHAHDHHHDHHHSHSHSHSHGDHHLGDPTHSHDKTPPERDDAGTARLDAL